jgi:ADP-ribose pyrophosphatase
MTETRVQLARQRVYSGSVVDLDIDRVRYPDGTIGELEIIRHPGASAIVPMLSDLDVPNPEVLLVRQYRYATGGAIYEVPAGRLNPGEAPLACAIRELREETGYVAQRIEALIAMYTTPGFTDERIHLFLASGLTAGASEREADEFLDLAPMPLARALEMIRTGEIQDAKTAVALLYVEQFRAGR